MAVSVSILTVVTALHLLAFVFAFGAERRRSTAVPVPDQYDEKTICKYGTEASTVYGMSAFGLLLVSQAVVNGVTKCLCFGKGLVTGTSYTVWAIVFFVVSWVSFLGAEACLLGGSARNAYHTKSEGIYKGKELSCAVLPVGVFAAGAAFTLMSLIATILYYLAHSKADTGGWEKHQNDGINIVADIMFWKNKKESGTILGVFTLIWFLFEVVEYPFITFLCQILLLFIFIFLIWSYIGSSQLIQSKPPSINDLRISESNWRFLFNKINWFIIKLYDISSGKDFRLLFLAVVSLWILSVVGNYFSSLTLLYIVFVGLETIPMLYEQYEEELTYAASKSGRDMKKLLNKFNSKVINKIPKAQAKTRRTM